MTETTEMRHLHMETYNRYNYTYAELEENDPATTTTNSNDDNIDAVVDNQTVVLIFLVGFTIFVSIVIWLINRRRRQQQQQWEAYLASSGETGSTNLSPQEVQGNEATRYNRIENWIISKQIHAHDDLCSKCMMAAHITTTTATATANPCSSSSKHAPEKQRTRTVKTDCSVDMTDEEWGGGLGDDDVDNGEIEEDEGGHECPICFEEFQVGDVASWSPESTYKHIFHHACIKEWLLKNSGCPICRAIFLPVDRMLQVGGQRQQQQQGGGSGGGGIQQMAELLQAQQEHKKSQEGCYYCIEHGIVTLPNVHNKSRGGCSCRLTQEEMEQAAQRAKYVPSKQVLVEMRGGHSSAVIAKPLSPLVTESSVPTTTATSGTADDAQTDQRDIESFPDSHNNNNNSDSSSTAETMSTCHLELNQGDGTTATNHQQSNRHQKTMKSSQNLRPTDHEAL